MSALPKCDTTAIHQLMWRNVNVKESPIDRLKTAIDKDCQASEDQFSFRAQHLGANTLVSLLLAQYWTSCSARLNHAPLGIC